MNEASPNEVSALNVDIAEANNIVRGFIEKGIKTFDEVFGEGYTEDHPELLATYVESGVYVLVKLEQMYKQ